MRDHAFHSYYWLQTLPNKAQAVNVRSRQQGCKVGSKQHINPGTISQHINPSPFATCKIVNSNPPQAFRGTITVTVQAYQLCQGATTALIVPQHHVHAWTWILYCKHRLRLTRTAADTNAAVQNHKQSAYQNPYTDCINSSCSSTEHRPMEGLAPLPHPHTRNSH